MSAWKFSFDNSLKIFFYYISIRFSIDEYITNFFEEAISVCGLVFTCGKKIRTHINWQISLFILQFFLNYFFLKTLTLTTIKKLFNLMQSFECDTNLWVNHITSFMKFHQVTTFNQFKTSEFSGVPEWKFGVTVMHQRLSRCQLLFTVFDVWLTTMFLWIRWVYYGNGSINTKNERIGSNTRIFVIRFQISKQR